MNKEIDLAKLESLVGGYATKPVNTLIDGVPDVIYHGGPGISNSGLNVLARSPAHYQEALRRQREQAEKKASRALDLGTVMHLGILQPELMDTMVAKRKKVDGRTKEGKEYNAEWEAEHAGKIGITKDEHDNMMFCVDAVRSHPVAGPLLQDGWAEQSAYWTWNVDVGEEIPVLARGRLDWLRKDGTIVDVKTTIDADPSEWSKSAAKFGYHRQNAWYKGGLSQILGAPVPGFFFVCIENKERPFGIRVLQLDEQALMTGQQELMSYLSAYARCVKNNEWPNYPSEPKRISLPHWYKAKITF